jgi:hypothetical protein
LPPKFHPFIQVPGYEYYRKKTREYFGESFDFPVFTTFLNLSDYFGCSFQELAKALCLQRGIMQIHDKAKIQGQPFYRAEILAAFTQSVGPDYAFNERNKLISVSG